MRVLRGRFSVCERASFAFGFESEMWDSVALVSDHFLFLLSSNKNIQYR